MFTVLHENKIKMKHEGSIFYFFTKFKAFLEYTLQQFLPSSPLVFVDTPIFALGANQIYYFWDTRCKHGLET